MTILRLLSRTAGLAALVLGVVGAGHAMGPAETLDTDGDGLISLAEIQVAMPGMTEAEFLALDSTGDGLLDADELAAAAEAGLITLG
ncbi:hypothetical protein [Roseicyclus persicicus]|uniref:EF-hand domain-containing protein n=1 Tax=Roseicyclus persicicus TaxID=2650661 RepID=A0A7X6H0P1_9RHOB|nr:hypothetical protein [Roseibacterium persicicum]NKX45800.1 hypothetical protein [Roseibacterium persicicum]